MGLNVRVGDYDSLKYICEHLGSYSGYNNWRKKIAMASGFYLNEMTGFGGVVPWDKEPFQLVLYHSDCDGNYSLNQIPKLLKELKEIKLLNIDDYDQSNKLIRLCKAALETKEPIRFE